MFGKWKLVKHWREPVANASNDVIGWVLVVGEERRGKRRARVLQDCLGFAERSGSLCAARIWALVAEARR
jgi:hypothetical protein